MSDHAPAAPSSLGAIVQCPAYVRMNAPFANTPRTEEQKEGDAAHWVALQLISSGETIAAGTLAPNGHRVTDEMIDGAILYADTVGVGGVPEMPVFATEIHPTACWGTPDWRDWKPIELLIDLADYKFGHRYVEAFECWQAVPYLSGVMTELETRRLLPPLPGINDEHVGFRFRIVQPRWYGGPPVREWRGVMSDLRPLVNIARLAVEKALTPDAPARAGPACYDCAARHTCAALRVATSSLMTSLAVVGDVLAPLEAAATGVELGLLDEAADLIEARRTGLKAQAETFLRAGQRVPGYALESVPGREKWNAATPIKSIITSAKLLGVDVQKPPALITPPQARKAGLDPGIVSSYSDRTNSVAVVKTSTIKARQAFGANKQ